MSWHSAQPGGGLAAKSAAYDLSTRYDEWHWVHPAPSCGGAPSSAHGEPREWLLVRSTWASAWQRKQVRASVAEISEALTLTFGLLGVLVCLLMSAASRETWHVAHASFAIF